CANLPHANGAAKAAFRSIAKRAAPRGRKTERGQPAHACEQESKQDGDRHDARVLAGKRGKAIRARDAGGDHRRGDERAGGEADGRYEFGEHRHAPLAPELPPGRRGETHLVTGPEHGENLRPHESPPDDARMVVAEAGGGWSRFWRPR